MTLRPVRLGWAWLLGAIAVLAVAVVAGTTIGAVSLPPGRVLVELLDHLPFVDLDSGLTARQADIVWELRAPRVALGVLVGGMLAMAGSAYQGVFRNALADPYLLGASAGAGLGATIAIIGRAELEIGGFDAVPLAAFAGALAAVGLAYALAGVGGVRSTSVLVLAGVAVASFLAAIQTFLQQQDEETLREVYSWLLGQLGTTGWGDVRGIAPYAVVTGAVLVTQRRALDVLGVGDDEAAALGLDVRRTRLLAVGAASLATAAAVATSGLIGFVGIVVPHTIRLLAGHSYRVIVPLSLVLGGAFLCGADIVARVALRPAEIPIGVVTAAVGAPFFGLLLRARRMRVW